MPIARFQMPDGRIARFEVPEGTTPEQAHSMMEAHFKGAAQAAPNPADRQAKIAAQMEADRKAYDPTVGMSTADKVLAGVGKAFADTGRGIAGLFGADNAEEVRESRRLDSALMDTGAGMAGNVGGHVVMALAPGGVLKGAAAGANALKATGAANALNAAGKAALAPTTLRGAATLGAGMGMIQPAENMTERVMNTGLGAGAGAGGQAAFNALARVVRPNTSPEVRNLMAEGITPTPGQILGGGYKRVEEGLTSIPIVGDAIKRGQTRAVEELNTAAFNRALEPIGETLPKGLMGREAVDHVHTTLSDRYETLLPKMTAKSDGQFAGEVSNLRQMVKTGSIDPKAAAAFERILKNDVLGKFKGQAAITGQTLKQIESDLGAQISRLARSTDADQRLVSDALQEVQSSLRHLVERNNPAQAAELKAINRGYANFKRVQRAASGLGAEDGVFSAAQLQNAVKATDRSKDKARFARGNALMQDLAEPAKAVLGPKVPDSGTPYRSMAALGVGGLAGGVTFGLPGAAAVAAAPVLYSRAGQNALATILARRPQGAEDVANALRQIAPYATAPAIGFANQ